LNDDCKTQLTDPILFYSTKTNNTQHTTHNSCSICVSGVCLTATVLDPTQNIFTVGLAPETLDKTYFRTLQRGQLVNLERASEIGGRNSGHFVQGHVDGTGTIVDKRIDGDSLRITIKVDEEHVDNIVRYIVPKGFIAIDGTSLTVVDVDTEARTFSFMLVEYTQKKIIIPNKLIGEKVNLEVDVLGKYSETAMAALLPRMEALEAKVESLERRLSAAKSGGSSSRGGGGGNDKQNMMRPSSSSTASSTATTRNAAPDAAFSKPKRRGITEGTPSFKHNYADQGGITVDPNTYMMRAKGREEGGDGGAAPNTNTNTNTNTNDDDDDDDDDDGNSQDGSGGSSHKVSLNPDPKMDDNNGRSRMSGDQFFTVS
jgi:riboflavin synthase